MFKVLKKYWLIILVATLFISTLGVIAGSTTLGYRANSGTATFVDPASDTDRKVVNESGNDYFVPTKTDAEWNAFVNNLPAGVSLCNSTYLNACGTGGEYNCAGTCIGGTCPAGTYAHYCKECDGSGGFDAIADDNYCDDVNCDTENYYYTSGSPSPTGTNYCYYRDYSDITTNRCEGENNCKETNDCNSYSNDLKATCGTCKYASGACSSCSNYLEGEDTGTCRECDGSGGEQKPADDSSCPVIDCATYSYYYANGSPSVDGTNTLTHCDYGTAVISSNRCDSLGVCKDADDCGGQCVLAASCGVCKKAVDGYSTCQNYTEGTDCNCSTAYDIDKVYIAGFIPSNCTGKCNSSGSCIIK